MSNPKYQPDEIVWAKSHGCPWWPAKINKICMKAKSKRQLHAIVDYIGDDSHEKLIISNRIAPFNENYAEHSKTDDIHLKYSIASANRILSKRSTFEGTFTLS